MVILLVRNKEQGRLMGTKTLLSAFERKADIQSCDEQAPFYEYTP